jgi:hypothetical protein
MGRSSDRDSKYMHHMWGTDKLVTDYDALTKQSMLREIANDEITPKKHDFFSQNEIHKNIRNDSDYDDWEYGTEPLYEAKK